MSDCEFKVGQRVVCVNAAPRPGFSWGSGTTLIEGNIYTIIGIIPSLWTEYAPFELMFAEARRDEAAALQHRPTYGYGCDRFKPLEEKEYDISIFRQMCVDAGKPKRKVKAVSGKND